MVICTHAPKDVIMRDIRRTKKKEFRVFRVSNQFALLIGRPPAHLVTSCLLSHASRVPEFERRSRSNIDETNHAIVQAQPLHIKTPRLRSGRSRSGAVRLDSTRLCRRKSCSWEEDSCCTDKAGDRCSAPAQRRTPYAVPDDELQTYKLLLCPDLYRSDLSCPVLSSSTLLHRK